MRRYCGIVCQCLNTSMIHVCKRFHFSVEVRVRDVEIRSTLYARPLLMCCFNVEMRIPCIFARSLNPPRSGKGLRMLVSRRFMCCTPRSVCHVSYVMYHVSYVVRRTPYVTCRMSFTVHLVVYGAPPLAYHAVPSDYNNITHASPIRS